MSNNLFEIDSAMNMIKEDIIRELSESVPNQITESDRHGFSSNNRPFPERRKG